MENYWKQRCEAAEAVVNDYLYKPDEENVKELFGLIEAWQQLKQTPSPTGDRDCEELKKRISELEEGLRNAKTRFKNLEAEYPEIAVYPSFWQEIEQLLNL